MSSNKEKVIEYIKKFGKSTNDTGSPEFRLQYGRSEYENLPNT